MRRGEPEDSRPGTQAGGNIPGWLLRAEMLQTQKDALARQQPADRIAELLAHEPPPVGSAS